MDQLKRNVERRSKGYERVDLSDPDDAISSPGASPPSAEPLGDGAGGNAGGSAATTNTVHLTRSKSDGTLEELNGANQRSIRILCALHFLNFACMHLTTLPYPKLVNYLVNGNLSVTAESSYAAGWLISTNSMTQFMTIKFWSVASDAHGRKPYILVGMVALCVYAIIFATAGSITALLIGFALEGTFATGWTIGQAYISDASTPDNRAKNFATYYGISQGSALGVGAIGGLALLSIDIRAPFTVAAVLLALNVPLTLCFLPETLPLSKRIALDRPCAQGNPCRAVAMVWRRGTHFRDMMGAFCMAQTASLFMANTWINFTDAAFGWGTGQAGVSIIIYGALLAPVPRHLIGKLGESRAMVLGLDLLACGFLTLAMAGYGGRRWAWVVWPCILVCCSGMMFDSAMRSYITKLVPESEQGSLQGTLSALTLLCNVLAGFVSNHALGWLISSSSPVFWPGGQFVLASMLFGLASLHARRAMRLHSSGSSTSSSISPTRATVAGNPAATPPRLGKTHNSGSSDDEFESGHGHEKLSEDPKATATATARPSPSRPAGDAP
jgi:DHA1 family tetracycline resistance protein-like MFS transporter